MLIYYRYIKSDVETASLPRIHPIGALVLVCAAVWHLRFHSVGISYLKFYYQVARALRMHKTGVFVRSSAAFSEKDLGNDTVIYLSLISKMSESRWTAFYNAVKISEGIVEDLKKCLRENPEVL